MPASSKRKRKPRTGRDMVTVPITATRTGRLYHIGMGRKYARGATMSPERRAAIQAKADYQDQLDHPEDYA